MEKKNFSVKTIDIRWICYKKVVAIENLSKTK